MAKLKNESRPYRAENLTRIRNFYGYDQNYIAGKLAMQQTVYSRYENNKEDITEDIITKLTGVYNFPIATIIDLPFDELLERLKTKTNKNSLYEMLIDHMANTSQFIKLMFPRMEEKV